MTLLPRDFIGYGKSPPHAKWPNSARLAINFAVNIEEGAERSVLEGDKTSENYLTELALRQALNGERDYFSESIFEYGSRCGIWRLLNLFEQHNLKITAWACGLALQKNPLLAAHLSANGHEIAGHGYRWIDYRNIPPEIERQHIAKTIRIIEHYTGEKPYGWYTGRKSEITRNLLVEAGIRYDSESYADDLPYWQFVERQAHLIIPYTFDVNDAKYFLTTGWMSGEDFLIYLQNTVRYLYREGEHCPKMMTVALHARISGHPGRAEVIHRFLEFLQKFPQIWVATRQQIAQHWYRFHPYSGARDNNE
ncbi:MAG: polysaccharide deacetylase family protein [Nitrosomonas sp.]|nr:polysaccharide deacetylase family protein [Nitrosomonas sp.]